uniref:Uncharacterized protein n=1 Tax=Tetranychus urticae TaxID=32264 RepID=T1KPC5_TETUR
MDIERCLIKGDERLEDFFCGYCHRLAYEPRVHAGGYEQDFCQDVFCYACTVALQDFDANKNYFLDVNGKKHARCPVGCPKQFNPPYFRPLSKTEKYHYNKIIIECPGCHQNFSPASLNLHRSNCVALRHFVPWVPNAILGRQNAVQARVRKHWLVDYESKNRVLSYCDSPRNDFPMTGNAYILKVFMSSGTGWESKFVPFCSEKAEFLQRIRVAFGLPNVDADVLVLRHRPLSAYPDVGTFINGISVGAPLMFCPNRTDMNNVDCFASWLLLETKAIKYYDSNPLVSADTPTTEE